jgi:hypothetical protein
MRSDVRDLLIKSNYLVVDFDDHPFGLGLFTMVDTLTADTVAGLTFEVDEITSVTFVKHDDARNMRITSFGQEVWVMFLGFPLDYQTTHYVTMAVHDFGRLSVWHRPRENKKFVLTKVWIVHPKFIPKSFIMWQLEGARWSWTMPVILLRSSDWNAHVHDVPPADDPEPEDGNPHPFYDLEQTAEQICQQQVALWMQ